MTRLNTFLHGINALPSVRDRIVGGNTWGRAVRRLVIAALTRGAKHGE